MPTLATSITRAASKQAYYTIRFLVDRKRIGEAYQAYAYFRWLDDWLDQGEKPRFERLAFVHRQLAVIDCCYGGTPPDDLCPEESMLASLIVGDRENNSGLQRYIRHMMAVMAFDARRRGDLIRYDQLIAYERHLAIGVTEALHYFIDHGQHSPQTRARYLSARGAHITHMLRDTIEDNAAGYFNIPSEYLKFHRITPQDIHSAPYKAWVMSRVHRARECFAEGRKYLAPVQNLRCRLSGYLYVSRFEWVLDAIERERYHLRPEYAERKGFGAGFRLMQLALWQALNRSDQRSVEPRRSRDNIKRALR
jgi:phytoene/squalene synthetase